MSVNHLELSDMEQHKPGKTEGWTTARTNSGLSKEQTHLTVIMVARGPSLILLLMEYLKLIGLLRESCRRVVGNILWVPGPAGVSLPSVRTALYWEHSFPGESSFIPGKMKNWTGLLDLVMDSGSKWRVAHVCWTPPPCRCVVQINNKYILE